MSHNINSLKKKRSTATIVADGKRFSHQINTDEVFGTHNGRPNAEKQILGFKPAPPLNKSATNIPSKCRIASIGLNHATPTKFERVINASIAGPPVI